MAVQGSALFCSPLAGGCYVQPAVMTWSRLLGFRVAEESRQYTVSVSNDALPAELRQIALQASLDSAVVQLSRLYRLANLLLQPEPVDRPADSVGAYALELRSAANSLEDILNVVIACASQDPDTTEPDSE